MDWLIFAAAIGIIVEIAITAGLLWLFFKLCEWEPLLQRQFKTWLALMQEKRDTLELMEHILLDARQIQTRVIGKWLLMAKTYVGITEKLAEIATQMKAASR